MLTVSAMRSNTKADMKATMQHDAAMNSISHLDLMSVPAAPEWYQQASSTGVQLKSQSNATNIVGAHLSNELSKAEEVARAYGPADNDALAKHAEALLARAGVEDRTIAASLLQHEGLRHAANVHLVASEHNDEHSINAVEQKLSERVRGILAQAKEGRAHDRISEQHAHALDAALGGKSKYTFCGELASKVAITKWVPANQKHSFDSKAECARSCPNICLSRQRRACRNSGGKPGIVTCFMLNGEPAGASYCTESRERSDGSDFSNCNCLAAVKFRHLNVTDAMQDDLESAGGEFDMDDSTAEKVVGQGYLLTESTWKPRLWRGTSATREKCMNKCDEHFACWYQLTAK
jgi:hypothetical protein